MTQNLGTAAYRLVLDARDFSASAVQSGKQMREVQQVMRQTETPAEKLAKSYDAVTEAFEKGQIPAQNYERYLQRLNAAAGDNTAAVNRMVAQHARGIPVIGRYISMFQGMPPKLMAVGAAFTAAGAAATAFVGVLYRVRQEMTELDKIGKSARMLGFDPSEMLGLQYAAERSAGVTAERVTASLTRLNHVVQQAEQGKDVAAQTMERLGLSVTELVNARPAERIRMIADAFAEVPTEAEQASIAVDLFGRGNAQMANFLRDGSEAIEELTDRWGDLTGLGGMDTRAIEEANDALADMSLAWNSMFTRLAVDNATDLAAALKLVTGAMTEANQAGQGESGGMIPWMADYAQLFADPASAWWSEMTDASGHAGQAAGDLFAGNFADAWGSTLQASRGYVFDSMVSPLQRMWAMTFGGEESWGEAITAQAHLDDMERAAESVAEAFDTIEPPIEEISEAIQATDSLIARYQDMIDTYGMSAREADLYRAARSALTDEELEAVEAARELAGELDELEASYQRVNEMMAEEDRRLAESQREADKFFADVERSRERAFTAAERAMDRLRTPEEKYVDTVQELMHWLDLGAVDLQQFAKLKQNAADELAKDMKVGRVITGDDVDAQAFGSAEMFRDIRRQQIHQAQMVNQPARINTDDLDKAAGVPQPFMAAEVSEMLNHLRRVADNTDPFLDGRTVRIAEPV